MYLRKSKNNIAVYTCITGNYDQPKSFVKEKGIDYILFTDQAITSNEWQVVQIDLLDNDPVKTNRWLKIKSLQALAGYNYTAYVDGNISIIKGIKDKIEESLSNNDIAFHKHHRSNNLSEDVPYMFKFRKLKLNSILKLYKQRIRYVKEGFRYKYFIEANIIYRKNESKTLNIFEKIWFDEFENNLKRDQISLCYSLWKSDISVKVLESADVREGSGYFKSYSHEVIQQKLLSKIYTKIVLFLSIKFIEVFFRSVVREND